MNRLLRPSILAAATAVLLAMPAISHAQQAGGGGGRGGRGNFDPEQMRARMMERYKQTLDVKDDDAWKVIEPRIQKVMEARREVGFGGGMRGMFGPGRRPPGAEDNQAATQPQTERRGPFGGTPSVAAQDLQKAIDSKASADQIKAKLAAYREERKQKQADLEKAQEELKKVLSVRQEAAAVLNGLLE